MTITCAIIDDEPLAAGLLESYAKKTPYLDLKGIYNSAILAMKDLRDDPVQLLFLDVQMPELSGLEFAKILPRTTMVIFTTAFPQYAIEGYKVNAIDYLLKPISYEDFMRSVDKALEWLSLSMKQDAYKRDRFMLVKIDYKLQRISLDDILYVEGDKDYVSFVMKNGEKVSTMMSLKKLEYFLPKPEFLRTHRSYIVHMPEAQLIDRFRIVFGDVYIPISEHYKMAVEDFLDQHTLA
jgi:DNA-binding LytR/AlgR family response regulator